MWTVSFSVVPVNGLRTRDSWYYYFSREVFKNNKDNIIQVFKVIVFDIVLKEGKKTTLG